MGDCLFVVIACLTMSNASPPMLTASEALVVPDWDVSLVGDLDPLSVVWESSPAPLLSGDGGDFVVAGVLGAGAGFGVGMVLGNLINDGNTNWGAAGPGALYGAFAGLLVVGIYKLVRCAESETDRCNT